MTGLVQVCLLRVRPPSFPYCQYSKKKGIGDGGEDEIQVLSTLFDAIHANVNLDHKMIAGSNPRA